jgi:hypothetical protein
MGRPLKILPSRTGFVLVGDRLTGGVLLRAYRRDGTVDRRFGRGGSASAATEQRGPIYHPRTAARSRDGDIVVAGTLGSGSNPGDRVELLRFR